MTDRSQLSYSALLEQIELWELTLRRQLKRLVFLKNESIAADRIANKKIVNRIEILQTEIETELLSYRKEKDKRLVDFDYVMAKYDLMSKGFVRLMDEINRVHELSLLSEDSLVLSRKSHSEIVEPSIKKQPLESNGQSQRKKNYMEETFTMRVNKENSKNPRTSSKSKRTAPVRVDVIQLQTKLAANGEWLENLIVESKLNRNSAVTVPKGNSYHDRKKTLLAGHNLRHKLNRSTQQTPDVIDMDGVFQVKGQLRDLKSAVLDLSKKIDSHGHEEYQRDLNKLKHNNKRILMDIKMIKEQNSSMMHQIHQTRKLLNDEKKLQQSMVKEFNRPTRTELERQVPYPEDVSDWVKQRLDRLSA